MKYQFCIRFENTTVNSAASKAILDCNKLLSDSGYADYTLNVWDNSHKTRYYILLVKELFKFFRSVKRNSIICIQYPLLSINNVFHYFIKLARVKQVKFFCIVHDLESLRTGGNDMELIVQEISNLNYFDEVIVHNEAMLGWLIAQGFRRKAVLLGIFDYLSDQPATNTINTSRNRIVFAGNLNKSTFIYHLSAIKNWEFKFYGPNFNTQGYKSEENGKWCGQYSPENIVSKLDGDFGLIWDGDSIEKCDEVLGNYLKFNNPHKFSLYLAAGLPVIAPAGSAIGLLVSEHKLGFLVKNMLELSELHIATEDYNEMKRNVSAIKEQVTSGYFLKAALATVEADLYLQE